jgi:hypothetical protein
MRLLSLPSKSALLNLSQSPASADICNNGNNACNGQRLEEGPAVVVQEEHTLHRDNTSKEKAVCNGARAEGLANVIEVSPKANPHSHQSGQCEKHCEHENQRDDLRRRLCICFENVVDLGLGVVALRRGWESERSRRVAGDVQVEDVLVDGSGGAEGGENDRSAGGCGRGQELPRKVFLGLDSC